MSLLRKIALAATIATAAGCSSYPDYDVKRRAQPLVTDNYVAKPVETPKEKPKETPKEVPKEIPKEAVEPKYERVEFTVDYQAEDRQTASLVRGYAAVTGQTDIKAAFATDKDKNGSVSYEEISDAIVAYTKEHGGEVKLLPVKDGNVFKYSAFWRALPESKNALLELYSKENAYGRMALIEDWEKKARDADKK
jgi:hypothetical protein